jgi:hypothetical protein
MITLVAVAAVAVHAPPNDATAFVAAASPINIIFKLTIGINFVECFVLKTHWIVYGPGSS